MERVKLVIVGKKADDILKSIIHTKVMKKSQIVRLWFTDPVTGKKNARQTIFNSLKGLVDNKYLIKDNICIGKEQVYRASNKAINIFNDQLDVIPFKSKPYKGLLMHQILLAEAYVKFVEQGKTIGARRKLSIKPVWQDAQGRDFQTVSSYPSFKKGIEKLADVFLGGATHPKIFIEIDNDSNGPKRLYEDLINWTYVLSQKLSEDKYCPPLIYICSSSKGANKVTNVFNKLSPKAKSQFNGFLAVPVDKTVSAINKFISIS